MNCTKVKVMLELARQWGMYEVEGGRYSDFLESDENYRFEKLNDWADEYLKSGHTCISDFFEKKLNNLLEEDEEEENE